MTTIFHVFSSAPPSALSGMTASFCFSGITIPPAEPTPGGFQSSVDRDRRGEARPCAWRRPSGPSTRRGPAAPWARRPRSRTAPPRSRRRRAGRRSESRTMTLFWPRTSSTVWLNSQGTFELGVDRLARERRQRAGHGGVGRGREQDRARSRGSAAIVSASNVTPAGRPSAPSVRSPPKSARLALTRIACRLPFGTATAIVPVLRTSDSFGDARASAAARPG